MGCAASAPAPDTRVDPSASPGKKVPAASTPAKGKGGAKAAGGILPAKKGAKGKYQMGPLFAQFDADGDGKLDIYEIARAFRALGLEKRNGEEADMDKAMFKSFDLNGDGYVTMEELDKAMPDKLRAKIDSKIDMGWKFDKATWDASVARHKKHDMKAIFAQFDADGDGKLDIYEIARAFRAFGLPKRDGTKMDVDKAMFKSFDTNGDGFVTMDELDANLKPKTRRKLEMAIEAGWKFDKKTWDESVARHNKHDMKAIFGQFDADGDGKLDIYEISRAFRAMGLPKRDGTKMDMDHAMFKSFDTNGDGLISMEELDKGMKPKTRRKVETIIEAGWTFDKEKWEASIARHNKYDMKEIFAQFDADGDGKLDIYEISRAFRAIGMPKRDGTKMEMDHATFKSFDTNGDGVISMEELDKGLKPKTRRKIEVLLEAGWTFDKAAWDASVARHNKYNLADIFKGFDRTGEGKIPMQDFYRAFRAMGLPKRDGEKMEMDKKMFDSFDSNGDGVVTLVITSADD